MFKTRITEMLDIKYPIIGGTMMYISRLDLVAAISAGGGLGILASANYKDLDEFRDTLKKIKDLTDKPFAVNLNLFPAIQQMDNNLYLDVMVEEGVKIVETSGHKAPDDLIDRVKDAGQILIHKCVAPRYAKKAEEIGVDAVAVVGWENGGATGILDIATMVLVPRAVDAVSIPVIGGGGIGDGRGLAAILSMGADAAIIGTLFLSAEEAGLHPSLRKQLLKKVETDTELIMRSLGNTHRVMKTEATKKLLEMENRQAGLDELLTILAGEHSKKLIEEGNFEAGILPMGQSVGFINKIKPAAEIISDLMEGAEKSLKRMNQMVQ